MGGIGAEVPSDPTVRCKGNADPLSQDTAAALRADQGFHSATVGQQSNSLHRRKVKGTGHRWNEAAEGLAARGGNSGARLAEVRATRSARKVAAACIATTDYLQHT